MNFYSVNLSNCKLNDPPTEKQVSYVREICSVLEIDAPEDYTKESYSKFISEYKDEYEEHCAYLDFINEELMFGLND